VKTRPASAARPSLPYRTFKLFLASLFQGVATGMNDSLEKGMEFKLQLAALIH